MDGLLTFLLFAGFFYLMMRYGCGAHMVHGHSHHKKNSAETPLKTIDPVCGMEVKKGQGYSKNNEGISYHFCSRKCLDKFDESPSQYLTDNKRAKQ